MKKNVQPKKLEAKHKKSNKRTLLRSSSQFFLFLCSFIFIGNMIQVNAFGWEQKPSFSSQGSQALDAQVRELNGRIEELNFQILQMQDQLQKMQKDTEFRFQELEKQNTRVPSKNARDQKNSLESSYPSHASDADVNDQKNPKIDIKKTSSSDFLKREKTFGAPPANLGTVVFDQNGNVIGGSVGDRSPVSESPKSLPVDKDEENDSDISSLMDLKDADALYNRSYNLILFKKYHAAEFGFRRHREKFSSHKRAADAQFWLGESLLGQAKYKDAAEVFLAGSKEFPKSVKAPEMLLKLGFALFKLDRQEFACVTFEEISKRYPNLSSVLRERIRQEKLSAGC